MRDARGIAKPTSRVASRRSFGRVSDVRVRVRQQEVRSLRDSGKLVRQPANTTHKTRILDVNANAKKDAFLMARSTRSTTGGCAPGALPRRQHEVPRARALDHGNFSWGSENVTRKTRIMDVTYNARRTTSSCARRRW